MNKALASALVLAPILTFATHSPSAAQPAGVNAQCSAAWDRLADPGTGTVDSADAAELLGDEFVEENGELGRAEFMSACRDSLASSAGSSSGEGGRGGGGNSNQ